MIERISKTIGTSLLINSLIEENELELYLYEIQVIWESLIGHLFVILISIFNITLYMRVCI